MPRVLKRTGSETETHFFKFNTVENLSCRLKWPHSVGSDRGVGKNLPYSFVTSRKSICHTT